MIMNRKTNKQTLENRQLLTFAPLTSLKICQVLGIRLVNFKNIGDFLPLCWLAPEIEIISTMNFILNFFCGSFQT